MIQEDVRLREDVAGPANRAATGVLALVAALTALSAAGAGECWHKKSTFKAHLYEARRGAQERPVTTLHR